MTVSGSRSGGRRRWVRRWESLHVMAQIAIVLPISVVLLWVGHILVLNQPVGRGFAYGVFWGALLTAAVVGASRSERSKRLAAEARRREPDEGPRPVIRRPRQDPPARR